MQNLSAIDIRPIALMACVFLASCYQESTQETTLGSIGSTAVEQVGETVAKALFDQSEAERERLAAELAAQQIELQLRERIVAEREFQLQRASEIEGELRRELDLLKANREVLYGHLDKITTANVAPNCPMGDASRTIAVFDFLRNVSAQH